MSEVQQKTSGLAIASLVCGCLFLVPFLGIFCSLAAIITGIIAIGAISKNKDLLKGKGLAIAGIALGGVGIVIIIIGVIALVTLSSSSRFTELREAAQEASCQGQAASIQVALANYYGQSALDNPEPSYPWSLYDSDFLKNLSDNELPEHPQGRDWNDFYDSDEGILDVEGACTP